MCFRGFKFSFSYSGVKVMMVMTYFSVSDGLSSSPLHRTLEVVMLACRWRTKPAAGPCVGHPAVGYRRY